MSQNHTLRKGDHGADGWVEYLQELLRHKYSWDNELVARMSPGMFDDVTEQLVVNYQTVHGLDNSGVVGDETWSHLRDEPFTAAAGTDGRGSDYVERGVELRFVEGFYEASRKISVKAASIGTQDPPAGSVQAVAFLRHPDGSSPEIAVEQLEPFSGSCFFYTDALPHDLPPGVYGFLIQLPHDTGGDTYQFEFNILPE